MKVAGKKVVPRKNQEEDKKSSTIDVISVSSNKTLDASNKMKCEVHKRERVQFYCQDDQRKLCGLCVPLHSGHELINMKERCSQLAKPWIDMRIYVGRCIQRIEQN